MIQPDDIFNALNTNSKQEKKEAFFPNEEPYTEMIPIGEHSDALNTSDLFHNNTWNTSLKLDNALASMEDTAEEIVSANNTSYLSIQGAKSVAQIAASIAGQPKISKAEPLESQNWVSESFTSTNFIDTSKTTMFINTALGHAELPQKSFNQEKSFKPIIDKATMQNSNTRPGASLLIRSITQGTSSTPTDVILDSSYSTSLSSIYDSNNNTWFEAERVFVPPVQKLIQRLNGFVADGNGKEEKILEITQDLDWKASIGWTDGTVDEGSDNKGVYIVEFKNIKEQSEDQLVSFNQDDKSNWAKVKFTLETEEPKPISSISLGLIFRGNGGVLVEEAYAEVVGVADPVYLVRNKQIDSVANYEGLAGSIGINPPPDGSTDLRLFIPSDRPVKRIIVVLSSPPVSKVKIGHPYAWIKINTRTVRKYLFVSSVDKFSTTERVPVFETPPIIQVSYDPNTSSTNSPDGPDVQSGDIVQQSSKDPLGFIGDLAGPAAGSILSGGGLNLTERIGLGIIEKFAKDILNFGSASTTKKVEEVEVGYDVFDAYRAYIALNKIHAEVIEYQDSGTVETINRIFPADVTKIALIADIEVPSNWPLRSWVDFFVSVDDGAQWIKVEESTSKLNYVDLPHASKKIKIKAVSKLNTADKYRSIKLNHIAVRGI